MTVRELGSPPNLTLLFPKAVFTALGRGGDRLPDLELVLPRLEIDPGHLASFARVCGLRLGNDLPVTYPHILAFPLAMELMIDRSFPFALPGLVHIGNRIDQRRPVRIHERPTLRVSSGGLGPHRRGARFEIRSEVSVAGETVWQEVSTYLRPGATPAGAASEDSATTRSDASDDGSGPGGPSDTPSALWRVPGDVGRRYGAVSGDRNPIHLNRLAARAFGFPRAIAHGMWTKTRCLAAFEGRLPSSYTVDVQFKAPVPLPSTVAFRSERDGEGWRFSVHDAKQDKRGEDTKPHLLGTISV